MQKRRWGLIILLVTGVTVLHYGTSPQAAPLHLLYRELYLLPIVLAGLWGGKRRGLVVSLGVTALYLPHVFLLSRPQPAAYHHMMGPMMQALTASVESTWGNIFEIALFNLAGALTGAYADLKRGYGAVRQRPFVATRFHKRFLLYVEDSPVSLYAAHYFADVFGDVPELGVTLLWVSSGADPDYFETLQEAEDYEKALNARGKTLLEEVKGILVQGGIEEARIGLRVVGAGKKVKLSDKIIEVVEKGDYDTIVLGKHRLSKSQEFLFGSVAVRLVREGWTNVLAVRAPAGEPDEEPEQQEAA